MSYENVNVTSLKVCLATIDNLDSSALADVIAGIDASSWESPSRTHVCNAIQKLINEIDKTKTLISNYKTVADNVEKVKQLEKENDRIRWLNNECLLSLNKIFDDTKLEQSINNKISEYNSQITSNNNKIKTLKSSIESMLG